MAGETGAILIAGPTASGKSGLAVALAERLGGEVVNADSMQVYDGLAILTARPTPAEMRGVPHHLYGHRTLEQPYSVGDWLREALPTIAGIAARGRVPIVCGGTGLYFRALEGGLDEAPPVPPEIRERWRQAGETSDAQELHAQLHALDPRSAERLRPTDRQRIVRALELAETRARGSAHAEPSYGTDLPTARRIVLTPDRALLRTRIAERFERMLEAGAIAEAASFLARPGVRSSLAGKAIGLSELGEVVAGRLDVASAAALAVTRSRQYAKRQETWFRNQFGPLWERVADAAALPMEP